jgi:hypothetical protein
MNVPLRRRGALLFDAQWSTIEKPPEVNSQTFRVRKTI